MALRIALIGLKLSHLASQIHKVFTLQRRLFPQLFFFGFTRAGQAMIWRRSLADSLGFFWRLSSSDLVGLMR